MQEGGARLALLVVVVAAFALLPSAEATCCNQLGITCSNPSSTPTACQVAQCVSDITGTLCGGLFLGQYACKAVAKNCSGIVQPGEQCVFGACDPATGSCVRRNVADGAACSDGDKCTDDVCVGGRCVSTPKNCSAVDGPCTKGVCQASSGICVIQTVNQGLSCPVADKCSVGACVDNLCVSSPKNCSSIVPPGEQCLRGVCNAVTGNCALRNLTDGTACSDGNACTDDVCLGGRCVSTPKSCVSLNSECTLGVCSATNGSCVMTLVNQSRPCTPANVCSTAVCVGQQCVSSPKNCSSVVSPGEQCVVPACNPLTGACQRQNATDGTSCTDANLCTVKDACVGSVCRGTPKNCSALTTECTVGVCNATTGTCFARPRREGLTCAPPAGFCGTGKCTAGKCVTTRFNCTALGDGVCSQGRCNATSGKCVSVPINEGGDCDPRDPCTVNATCTAGSCRGRPKDCSSLSDQCLRGVCNSQRRGICEALPDNEGGPCEDGDPCTVDDVCGGGVCLPGGNFTCIQPLAECRVARCINSAANAACRTFATPGDECAQEDLCNLGMCMGSGLNTTCKLTPTNCSAFNSQCTLGVCNPDNGDCEARPTRVNATCTDNNKCTTGDVCLANGTCRGKPVVCAPKVCKIGACNPSTGACAYTNAKSGVKCTLNGRNGTCNGSGTCNC